MKRSQGSPSLMMTLPALSVVIALALLAPDMARGAPSRVHAAQQSPSTDRGPSASRASATLLSQLSRQMALAGGRSGAYVYDLSRKTPLFALRAGVPRPPASLEKLYTATTALELMGPQAALTTTVLGSGQLAADGSWQGSLYLRGGGDPTFGSSAFIVSHYGDIGSAVSTLAGRLKAAGIRSVTGGIYGDESYFDSLRGEPASGYRPDPELEGELSALSFDRGEIGHERGPHAPAAYAARQLRMALAADGIHTGRAAGAARAPPGATVLAELHSPPLKTLLELTLPPSDNFFAETLLKDIGARFAGAGSTASGVAVVRRTIARFGIHARMLDGSGLSHSDATTPSQVVSLLVELATTPAGTVLRDDMAVAGHSGTLATRMRGTLAAGRCQAKTGTLIGVSNLAGYCEAANGHVIAFAFFTDGLSIERAHTIQDAMAITLARY